MRLIELIRDLFDLETSYRNALRTLCNDSPRRLGTKPREEEEVRQARAAVSLREAHD